MLNGTKLVERLPQVRGRYSTNTLLNTITWFRVGGPAEVLYKPADLEDLSFFMKNKPSDIPVTMIGVGSNLLVRDGGVPGVVVRLGRHFNTIIVNGSYVDVGAGVLDRTLAMLCRDQGLGNLEFLCGIPGTIGGALRMNAGCYGTEIKDVIDSALAMDTKGKIHRLSKEELGFRYRHCSVPKDWIFLGARFQTVKKDPQLIDETMKKMLEQRDGSQPVRSRTGGSTFANPEGESAWKLIDEAGCRGLMVGDAQMSEKHCNFMINKGEATAEDLEALGEMVRQKVKQKFHVDLRWEIIRIGVPLKKKNEQAA